MVDNGQDIRRRLYDRINSTNDGVIQPERLAQEWQVNVDLVYEALQSLKDQGRIRSFKPGPDRIFIGHGRSVEWRKLKDFLVDRLGLKFDEFDLEPGAGFTIAERLFEMLEGARFAFLVMTAEDERSDGTMHARENVIHEAGLFQGKLGRHRAIILLEEGCQEFSNIHGLLHISFPRSNLEQSFEKVRGVLEREKIIMVMTTHR